MKQHFMYNLKNIEAVIFDLDGTLYDFKGLTKNILSRLDFTGIFRAGLERKLRKSYAGKSFASGAEFAKYFFSDLAKAFHLTADEAERWYNDKYCVAMASALQDCYSLRPSVIELFKALRESGIKTAIFSDYGSINLRLQSLGFEKSLCDFAFSAAELGGLKPAKESFLKIASYLETKPEKILMVGDRLDTDGKGASFCGMQFIQIKNHKNKKARISDALEWNEFLNLFLS